MNIIKIINNIKIKVAKKDIIDKNILNIKNYIKIKVSKKNSIWNKNKNLFNLKN